MAIPPDAVVWDPPFDPSDKAPYLAQFGGGGSNYTPLLNEGESIASFTVAVLAESVALGLSVIQSADHGPFIADGKSIELWFEVDPILRADPAFSGKGTLLPVEFLITTNSTPPRRFQRTAVLKVLHL